MSPRVQGFPCMHVEESSKVCTGIRNALGAYMKFCLPCLRYVALMARLVEPESRKLDFTPGYWTLYHPEEDPLPRTGKC